MKKILLAAILLLPFAVFADSDNSNSDQSKQEKFEAKKAELIQKMDERKACVEKATKRKDLKKCMKHHHKEHNKHDDSDK